VLMRLQLHSSCCIQIVIQLLTIVQCVALDVKLQGTILKTIAMTKDFVLGQVKKNKNNEKTFEAEVLESNNTNDDEAEYHDGYALLSDDHIGNMKGPGL